MQDQIYLFEHFEDISPEEREKCKIRFIFVQYLFDRFELVSKVIILPLMSCLQCKRWLRVVDMRCVQLSYRHTEEAVPVLLLYPQPRSNLIQLKVMFKVNAKSNKHVVFTVRPFHFRIFGALCTLASVHAVARWPPLRFMTHFIKTRFSG